MSISNMPTLFRYVFIDIMDNEKEYIFTDAKGWDEITFALIRGENNGINSEQSAPIFFSEEQRDFIKSKFALYGVFAKIDLRIDKRNEDWTYSEFNRFSIDFFKYSDDLRFISNQLIECNFRSLINSNIDTEFDINLSDENIFPIQYTYLPTSSLNTLQASSGQNILNQIVNVNSTTTISYSSILSKRASRALSNNFNFVDENDDPYKYFRMDLLRNLTALDDVKIKVKVKFTIEAENFLSPAVSSTLILSYGDNTKQYTPTYTTINGGKRIDTFDYPEEELLIIGNQGSQIRFDFEQNIGVVANFYWSLPNVTDGDFFTIKTDEIYESDEDAVKINIKTSTIENAISQILYKLNSTLILDYKIDYFTSNKPYIPLLTSTFLLYDNNTLRVKLSDLLKTLDLEYGIGVDLSVINGNPTFTIDYDTNFYINEESVLVESKYVKINYDEKHFFNSIKVGSDTSTDKDVYLGAEAFICEKNFILDTQITTDNKKELNLFHPYKIDMYSIDKWIKSSLNDTQSKKNDSSSDIAVFCCSKKYNPFGVKEYIFDIEFQPLEWTISVEQSKRYIKTVTDTPVITSEFKLSDYTASLQYAIADTTKAYKYICELDGYHTFEYSFKTTGMANALNPFTAKTNIYKNGNLISGGILSTFLETAELVIDGILEKVYDYTCTVNEKLFLRSGDIIEIEFLFNDYANFYLEKMYSKFSLTQADYTMYELLRDENSIKESTGRMLAKSYYNVPFSPKRILLNKIKYIAISNWKNTNSSVIFVSSKLSSNLVSQMSWETNEISENSNLDLTGVTPLFLPCSIEFETNAEYDIITEIKSNKYKYISTVGLDGFTYSGWIEKCISSIGKTKTQSWSLIAKTIL